MLKFMMLFSILLGLATGLYVSKLDRLDIKASTQALCPKMADKKDVFETENQKRCVTRFKSSGEKFSHEKVKATQILNDIFRRQIRAQEVREKEFNIYINKDENDKRIRRYDPRLDFFARFGVKNFVKDNSLISNYSVSSIVDRLFNIEDQMKNIVCEQPVLSKLRNTNALNIFNELNRNKYGLLSDSKSLNQTSKNFSAFSELIQKKSWYLYFIQGHNDIQNFLLANKCNNTIALAVNHCVVKPDMDMQLEEILWFPNNEEIGINTYCKKSEDNKWHFMNTKVLTKL